MRSHPTVQSLLEDWHSQTLLEQRALLAQDWPAVERCQQRKAEVRAELAPLALPRLLDEHCRQLLKEVLALEAANRDWLSSRLCELQTLREEAECTTRNLRRVRASYAPAREAGWASYS